MATKFDPVKAQNDQLIGLTDIYKILVARSRDIEQRYVEVEAEHKQLLNLTAFVRDLIDKARRELERLKDAHEQTK